MRRHLVPIVCLALALAGCAGGAAYRSKPVAAAAVAPADEAPLDRSLFSKDPQGRLSEDDLQRILDSPIELDLPARVGVLPVVPARDWRGPGPSYDVPAGVAEFVKALRSGEDFSLVTEMVAIPSGALGMEALREIAARYRLRYIVLYRERFDRRTRWNEWAWGYATVVGALFLPGQTLRVDGYLEASLFDVKTGLFLFTVRRAVSGRRDTNVYHHGDKLEAMQVELARRFAPELALDLKRATDDFERAAALENERRQARAASGTSASVVVTP